jgi:glycerol-3-phosphate dehydrogenase
LKKEHNLREIYSVKKTLSIFEKKFNKIQTDLKWLKEREVNLQMENEQMQTVNELLENRKNNIFYTSDTSFDDAVTVRLTDFNQEQEIEKTRQKQKKIRKIIRLSFAVISVIFFLLSYPILGLMIGY